MGIIKQLCKTTSNKPDTIIDDILKLKDDHTFNNYDSKIKIWFYQIIFKLNLKSFRF